MAPRSAIKVQIAQPLKLSDDITNHAGQMALAVLRVPQGDDALVEVDIAPLESVLLTLPHPCPEGYVELANVMSDEPLQIGGDVRLRLNVIEQRSAGRRNAI